MLTLSSLDWIEALGWLASALTVATYAMNTMLTLRIVAIVSSVFFVIYTVALHLWPLLMMELLLLPINCYRLWQILRIRGRLSDVSEQNAQYFSIIKTYGKARNVKAGEVIFAKDDPVNQLYYVGQGIVRIEELNIDITEGDIFGEIAFFNDSGNRTATARCVADAKIYELDRKRFMRLQFEDPSFGMSIMRTVTRRLTENAQFAPA